MWSVKCGVESGECELLSLKGGVCGVRGVCGMRGVCGLCGVCGAWSVKCGVECVKSAV